MSEIDIDQKKDQPDLPEPQPATPPEPTGQAEPPRLAEKLQRIEDYRRHAHRQSNLQLATVGQLTANLMEVSVRFNDVVLRSLADGELSMDDLEAYSPAFAEQIRLDKQVAQLAQLELNIKKSDSISLPKPTW